MPNLKLVVKKRFQHQKMNRIFKSLILIRKATRTVQSRVSLKID